MSEGSGGQKSASDDGDLAAACALILDQHESGAISAQVALMEMLIASEDEALLARVLSSRAGSSKAAALLSMLEQNAEGCARIATMLRSDMDTSAPHASIEEGIAFSRRLFDWSVRQSEEASVALYSLGNPALLAEATREIEELLEGWGALGEGREALDIGCGIGRLEQALAPKLARMVGIDVSGEMIAAAKRRCGSLSNVTFSTCSGADLRELADASFDLVLAVDCFPYLVQSGAALVDTYFAEIDRVLRAHGELVLLNYSYRDDRASDRRDVRALAQAHHLALRVDGTTPFRVWNGLAFHLVKA